MYIRFIFLFALLTPILAMAQNYVAIGDSCFKAGNYREAARNYDLYLEKVESRSNVIALRSAKAWGLAGDKTNTLTSVRKYIENNYDNGVVVFSDQLLKEKDFDFLKSESEWKQLLAGVLEKEAVVQAKEKKGIDSIVAIQDQLMQKSITQQLSHLQSLSVKRAYSAIRNYSSYPKINIHALALRYQIAKDLFESYVVVLPKSYTPQKKYPLLFFLHGAVYINSGFPQIPRPDFDTTGWNRFYTKYAAKHEVIMVYPHANREYNWLFPDKGFSIIPGILSQIKEIINVDDNKIFISGHSNGASGSFSYAVKEPSYFAGFYGFNTQPIVRTGDTFLMNLKNRSFFNVSTDHDYYYPPDANDSLDLIMKEMEIDYQDHRYNGFPHWFPQFNESESAFRMLFEDLQKRKRDPFQKTLFWECDDTTYGRCDWLQIIKLDTLDATQDWNTHINFAIKKWIVLDRQNKSIVRDTLLTAYNYKRRSGAVKAVYKDNIFTITASNVGSVRVYLSPEMVDFRRPVIVRVNGVEYVKAMVKYNKTFMLKTFYKTLDREATWVNYIDVQLN